MTTLYKKSKQTRNRKKFNLRFCVHFFAASLKMKQKQKNSSGIFKNVNKHVFTKKRTINNVKVSKTDINFLKLILHIFSNFAISALQRWKQTTKVTNLFLRLVDAHAVLVSVSQSVWWWNAFIFFWHMPNLQRKNFLKLGTKN